MSGPKEEIGHGKLARRALEASYHLRKISHIQLGVSEIAESNGSTLWPVFAVRVLLMDAGIPLKAAVAGIAMGLVKEDEGFL